MSLDLLSWSSSLPALDAGGDSSAIEPPKEPATDSDARDCVRDLNVEALRSRSKACREIDDDLNCSRSNCLGVSRVPGGGDTSSSELSSHPARSSWNVQEDSSAWLVETTYPINE